MFANCTRHGRCPGEGSLFVVPICFFFNDTATTEIYSLSLHDALPISRPRSLEVERRINCRTWHASTERSRLLAYDHDSLGRVRRALRGLQEVRAGAKRP